MLHPRHNVCYGRYLEKLDIPAEYSARSNPEVSVMQGKQEGFTSRALSEVRYSVIRRIISRTELVVDRRGEVIYNCLVER